MNGLRFRNWFNILFLYRFMRTVIFTFLTCLFCHFAWFAGLYIFYFFATGVSGPRIGSGWQGPQWCEGQVPQGGPHYTKDDREGQDQRPRSEEAKPFIISLAEGVNDIGIGDGCYKLEKCHEKTTQG